MSGSAALTVHWQENRPPRQKWLIYFESFRMKGGGKGDRFKVPGEDCERSESSNGAIYTSASVPLFHRGKQMPAKRGREKACRGVNGEGGVRGGTCPNSRPPSAVGQLLNTGKDFCLLRLANGSTCARCHTCRFTLVVHARGGDKAKTRKATAAGPRTRPCCAHRGMEMRTSGGQNILSLKTVRTKMIRPTFSQRQNSYFISHIIFESPGCHHPFTQWLLSELRNKRVSKMNE